jgi:TonB family protein
MKGIARVKLAGWVLIAASCLLSPQQYLRAQANAGGTTTEDLRGTITAALTAARRGDQAKVKEIAHNLIIPNYEHWLKSTFGGEQGAKMAAGYARSLENQEKWLRELFEGVAKQDGEVMITSARVLPNQPTYWCGEELVKAGKNNTEFYLVSLENDGPGGVREGMIIGYFAVAEGGYRALDCTILGLAPERFETPQLGQARKIIKVGGNVQAAKIVKRVQPVYPSEALKERIGGTVRLHIIVAKDGTIEQIEVISGHPLLLQAALDAVRQWRYQPTLLNGEPVEVDTTIDVIYSLNEAPTTNP